jgi:hypothetical protein
MELYRNVCLAAGCSESTNLGRSETTVADLADMTEQPQNEMRTAIRDTLQRVIDDLLFYSDEMETHRLPPRDGVGALRLAAGLFALTKELV